MSSDGPITIGMSPPHPGRFVKDEVLDPLELSVTKAADVLGVRRATLSDLVNGNAALSPEMALRVEKAFGVNMDMLLRMQSWWDTYAMRQKADSIVVQRYNSGTSNLSGNDGPGANRGGPNGKTS